MFSGSIPALATPFREGVFDETAYRRLIDWQIEAGSAALVPCGTTGEASTLSNEEHHRAIAVCVEQAAGRVPVIAGCGSNDTRSALVHLRVARDLGADAGLCVAPYYNRPSKAGLIAHFSHLAERSALPIVLYNVPSRTASDLDPQVVIELVKRYPEKIVAIKDASGELARVAEHRIALGEKFCQLSGNDDSWLAHNLAGGRGAISVTANVAPQLCAAMCRALDQGDLAEARRINDALMPLHRAMFCDASPGPVKYALSRIHDWFSCELRLPMVEPGEAARRQIDAAIEGLGLIA